MGGTIATDSTFTGPVLDLGSSLEVADFGRSVTFAPATGGPVSLTTGTLTIDPHGNLTGSDSFVADGMLTLSSTSQLGVSGTVDALGGMELGGNVVIQGTTLNNHATATWDLGFGPDLLESNATINNLAGATFTTAPGSTDGAFRRFFDSTRRRLGGGIP